MRTLGVGAFNAPTPFKAQVLIDRFRPAMTTPQMSRVDKRKAGLIAFASEKPLKGVFGVWQNPHTGRFNRLCGEDILVIDDVQQETFGLRMLSQSERDDRLTRHEPIGRFQYRQRQRKTLKP
jgi:hypothetical protein